MTNIQSIANIVVLNESEEQVKYKSEITTARLGDRVIRLENLTPILSPKEREEREREIENSLFQVFVKYTGKNKR